MPNRTRVLLIDPDETIASAFARLLRRLGFEAITASNERDAIKHLCDSALDAVILEPDTRGSWGRKLLAMRGEGVPFIVVSRFKPDDIEPADGVRWFTKPVSAKELAKALAGPRERPRLTDS